MKFQTLGPNKENTFVLVFDKGDEFISELTNFAKNSKLAGSHFTAIGAFRDVVENHMLQLLSIGMAVRLVASPGDPSRLQPTEVTFDLSPWQGQTVRLRLATADNQGPLRAGADNIWFERIAR